MPPEGEGTSGYVNMSNVMISDGSMREMIRSLNPQQGQTFDEVYVKENVLEIHWQIRKLNLSMFLYQEQKERRVASYQ